MPSLQIVRIEGRHGDHIGLKFIKRTSETIEVLAGGKNGEISVPAKLGCAVQYVGLTAHQEGFDAVTVHRGKDFGNRAPAQAGPPTG
jgi:hypothetical protein